MKNLLSIKDTRKISENEFETDITIESGHTILKAHFPNQPIIPGACLIETAERVLSEFLNKKQEISMLRNVKFLNIVNPDKTIKLKYSCSFQQEGDLKNASFTISSEGVIYSKLGLNFRESGKNGNS